MIRLPGLPRLPALTALLLAAACGLASAQVPDSARRAPAGEISSQIHRPLDEHGLRSASTERLVRAPGRNGASTSQSGGLGAIPDPRPPSRWTQLQ